MALPPEDLQPESATDLTIETALMIPTVSAILADGAIEDREITQVMALCLQNPIFSDNSEEEDAEIIMLATRLVQKDGDETMCKNAAAVLPPALRETAFAFAVAIVSSDGHIDQSEEALIDRLVDWLSIDPVRAQNIVSVIPILHNDLERPAD